MKKYTNQISATELRRALTTGPTQFAFEKKDGTLRIAFGTTNLSDIPSKDHPTGNGPHKNSISFFDLEKMGWRSIAMSSKIFFSK